MAGAGEVAEVFGLSLEANSCFDEQPEAGHMFCVGCVFSGLTMVPSWAGCTAAYLTSDEVGVSLPLTLHPGARCICVEAESLGGHQFAIGRDATVGRGLGPEAGGRPHTHTDDTLGHGPGPWAL